MSNAPIIYPHTTAFAVASGMCVRGSLTCHWLPGMAQRSASHPIDRGVPR